MPPNIKDPNCVQKKKYRILESEWQFEKLNGCVQYLKICLKG